MSDINNNNLENTEKINDDELDSKKEINEEDDNTINEDEEITETQFINKFIKDKNHYLHQEDIDKISKRILNLDYNFPKSIFQNKDIIENDNKVETQSNKTKKHKEKFNNKNYLKELEFFESNLDDETNTIFHKINNTKLTPGKYQLMNYITKPTNNFDELNSRKNNINYFLNNSDKYSI
jgi:hypothetical protein